MKKTTLIIGIVSTFLGGGTTATAIAATATGEPFPDREGNQTGESITIYFDEAGTEGEFAKLLTKDPADFSENYLYN